MDKIQHLIYHYRTQICKTTIIVTFFSIVIIRSRFVLPWAQLSASIIKIIPPPQILIIPTYLHLIL